MVIKAPDKPVDKAPPDIEERLRLMVVNGPDMIDIALGMIARWKLPYIIENGQLRSSYSNGELWIQKFITVDEDTKHMLEEAKKMAASPYEVLIIGDTGTGKELLAKSMIGNRKGSTKAVNCAGLPRELIESELFGYVKDAFTGASKTTDGLMTLAQDGVMFLDEIGELPLDVQAKLLRSLQDKVIRKVGGKTEESINCKFVCATNRDLKKMVTDGLFRRDLYARISTLELHIKPLEDRKCDIVPITESLPGGKLLLEKYKEELENGILDISLNVRSLQQHVIRYNVLGRLKI